MSPRSVKRSLPSNSTTSSWGSTSLSKWRHLCKQIIESCGVIQEPTGRARTTFEASPIRSSLRDNMDHLTNLTRLPTPAPAGITSPDSYDDHRHQGTPLIIDNGSTNLRFGFASSSTPHFGPNAVAKYKERKFNMPLLLFGDGIDAESGAKSQTRTPWEGDILLNFDALVCMFYTVTVAEHVIKSEFLTSRRRKMPLTMLL
jgi:hypothetical protein